MLDDNMSLDEAVPSTSNYLTKDDVGQGILAEISHLDMAELENDGKTERRTILHFQGDVKPMVLNQTNKELLKYATKATTVGGVKGKKIVLFNDPTVMFGGKMTGGIRIRAPRNQPEPEFHDDIPF